MKTLIFLSLVFALAVISGCVSQTPASDIPEPDVKKLCIESCQILLNEGRNLSAGPCILDPVPGQTEWVCDITHSPRQSVDDKKENQCRAWEKGTAKHFVEVTPECEFIREY